MYDFECFVCKKFVLFFFNVFWEGMEMIYEIRVLIVLNNNLVSV